MAISRASLAKIPWKKIGIVVAVLIVVCVAVGLYFTRPLADLPSGFSQNTVTSNTSAPAATSEKPSPQAAPTPAPTDTGDQPRQQAVSRSEPSIPVQIQVESSPPDVSNFSKVECFAYAATLSERRRDHWVEPPDGLPHCR